MEDLMGYKAPKSNILGWQMSIKPTISVNEGLSILEKQRKHKRNDHKIQQNSHCALASSNL